MNIVTFIIGFVVILALAIIGMGSTAIAAVGSVVYNYFFIVVFLYIIIHIAMVCRHECSAKYAFSSALCFSPIIECLCYLGYLCSVMENNFGDMIVLIIAFVISIAKYIICLLITVHLADEELKPGKTILQIIFWIGRIIYLVLFISSGIKL